MKNPMRRLFAILTLIGGALLSTAIMYVCSYVLLLGNLYDDEMARTLVLPVIMMLPALIIYLIWFSSKAKKFTNGTYPDRSPHYYKSVLFFIISILIQYLVGFIVTLPLFGLDIEVSVLLLPSLTICEIILLIVDILCFWIFKPIANDA